MNVDLNTRHPIEELADEFVGRFRRGELPSIEEYCRRFPDQADEIRELFPALVLMEQYRPVVERASIVPTTPMPEQIGDYRIVREIARGGMGIVYEAEQQSLGRRVALKILTLTSSSSSNHLLRFEQEARAVARLQHPHIVPIFDVGVQDGIHFYAMQFIDGRGLDVVLRASARETNATTKGAEATAETRISQDPATGLSSGPSSPQDLIKNAGTDHAATAWSSGTRVSIPSPDDRLAFENFDPTRASSKYWSNVARLGLQAAQALGHAHEQGIVHRDIKPSNLLLDNRGMLWVTDFGLAKSKDAGELTRSGDLVGTLRYMAPEQFGGWSDPRTDIHGLGLTLYELLALRPAYDGESHARIIQQITHESPPRPLRWNRQVPRDLETIVLKAIEKEPGHRYQSAGEMAADLQRFLSDEPILTRRASTTERLWRWCRRKPLVAGMTAAIATLLVVVAAGASILSLQLRTSLGRAERAEAKAKQNLGQLQQAENERTHQLYKSLLNQARAGRWSGRVGQRFESLEALAAAARLSPARDPSAVLELRNEAIACLALADVRLRKQWDAHEPGYIRGITFDSQLQRYTRVNAQGELSICRVADNTELARLPAVDGEVPELTFSPNGEFLATRYSVPPPGKRANLAVWSLQDRRMLFESEIPAGRFAVSFSPNNQTLAVGHAERGEVCLYDFINDETIAQLTCSSIPFRLAFHPDGSKLAIAGSQLEVHDIAAGKVCQTLVHPGYVHDLAWHAEGILLATACLKEVYIWDTSTGQRRAALEGHQAQVSHVNFANHSDTLFSGSWDGTGRMWEIGTGRQLLSTPCSSVPGWDIYGVYSVKGQRISMLEANTGAEYRLLSSFEDSGAGQHDANLSPDGRWLAVAADDGVRLWDLKLSRHQAFLPLGRTLGVIFHPSGDELFTSGPLGVTRWPFSLQANELHIGPPKPLLKNASLQRMSLDAKGQMMAVAGGGLLVVDLLSSKLRYPPLKHPQAVFAAMSPDGRWVATSSWNGKGILVWETDTGKLVRDLVPDASSATVAFSPDGQWLVTHAGYEARIWQVGGDWRNSQTIATAEQGLGMAFSRDGKQLALEVSRDTIQLIDPATGRLLAKLTAPDFDISGWMRFTGDGSQLLVSKGDPRRIRIWDLRLVRERLADLGLDWNAPSYGPADSTDSVTPVVTKLDLGQFAVSSQPAATPMVLNDRQQLEQHTRNVEANPDNAKAYYDRGVVYARIKDKANADADMSRALELYNREIQANPNDSVPYHNRGHIHDRFGDYAQAVTDFTRAIQANPNDLHLLEVRGMAFQCGGQRDEAIRDYKRILELKSGQDSVLNALAWLYVTGPRSEQDPFQALPLAQKAVELSPKNSYSLSTLGLVHYQLDEFELALEMANRSIAASPDGGTAFEFFMLAMCHHKLGDIDKARESFDQAVAWMEKQSYLPAHWVDELKQLREEAEAVLKGLGTRSRVESQRKVKGPGSRV